MNAFKGKVLHNFCLSLLCYIPTQNSFQKVVNFFCFSNPTKSLSELVTIHPPLTLRLKVTIILVLKSDLILIYLRDV